MKCCLFGERGFNQLGYAVLRHPVVDAGCQAAVAGDLIVAVKAALTHGILSVEGGSVKHSQSPNRPWTER